MKKCPFCAEEIQDDAIKCRYCNEFLDGRPTTQPQQFQQPQPAVPWYFKTSTWILVYLCGLQFALPIVLPMIWLNPRYSRTKKIILSVILSIISYILFKITMTAVGYLKQYYDMIGGKF